MLPNYRHVFTMCVSPIKHIFCAVMWRHLHFLASYSIGHSTVCIKSYSSQHQRNHQTSSLLSPCAWNRWYPHTFGQLCGKWVPVMTLCAHNHRYQVGGDTTNNNVNFSHSWSNENTLTHWDRQYSHHFISQKTFWNSFSFMKIVLFIKSSLKFVCSKVLN